MNLTSQKPILKLDAIVVGRLAGTSITSASSCFFQR
jgi:hypothetical protein